MVAAVALNTVLEDYEAAFVEAGFSPGVVLPSMLAALGGAPADLPTLVVKVDVRTTSIAILDKQQLLLFRFSDASASRSHRESRPRAHEVPAPMMRQLRR